MADWQPPATDQVVASWQPPASDKIISSPSQPAAPGVLSRFAHGLADPAIGAAQLLSHNPLDLIFGKPAAAAAVPTLDKTLDAYAAKRAADYDALRKATGQTGIDWARLAGNVANPLNYVLPGMGAPASLAGRLGLAALSGAGSAALQPVEKGPFGKEKGKQLAAGAIAGPVAETAASVAAKTIAPKVREAAAELASHGVPLTIGQYLGGLLRRAESSARSVPALGSLIKKREQESIEGFNRATINQTLAPIGATLPKDMGAGHQALKYAARTIGQQFDAIWPRVSFKPDAAYGADINKLRTLVGELPKPERKQVTNFIKNRVIDRFKNGIFDGEALSKIDTDLGRKAAQYRSSGDPVQREMAEVFDDLQSAIRDGVQRQNPQESAALDSARRSYAMLVRVENAASRRAGSAGVFSPLDLLSAIRGGSSRVRRRDFVHGDAALQHFAESAQQVIPETVPDSGTPERALWDALLLGGAGEYLFGPQALAAGAAGIPYIKPVQRAIGAYLAPSTTRQAVRSNAESVARMLAGAGGAVTPPL